MKRTKPLKRSPLKRSQKPIKPRGRSRFPKRRDPDFVEWVRGRACALRHGHICRTVGQRFHIEPAHLKTQGSGGGDLWNIVPMCPWLHDQQEGKTREFEVRFGVDLTALAAQCTQQYHDETGRPIL